LWLDGAPKVAKEVIEDIDNTKLSTTFKVIEGDLMEAYKSFKVIVQATPKGHGSVVHWTLIFEKLNENIPAPTAFLDNAVDFTKDINAHMTQAKAWLQYLFSVLYITNIISSSVYPSAFTTSLFMPRLTKSMYLWVSVVTIWCCFIN